MTNRERKKLQAKCSAPQNVTCGGCHQIYSYEGILRCPHCGYGDPENKEAVTVGS